MTTISTNTYANWNNSSTILQLGEIGYETDTHKIKVGDGVHVWAALPYANAVESVAGKTGIVELTAADLSDHATVWMTSSYTDLINAPTKLSNFINDTNYITASQAPVKSVAGRTGTITLTASDITGLAAVASTGSYTSLTGKPTLSAVATTGKYTDLTNKPSFATVATSGDYNDLINKPSSGGDLSSLSAVAFSGSYTDLINVPSAFDASWTNITGKPTFATVATSGDYNDLINKPSGTSSFSGSFTDLTSKPTTLSGYGITDAINTSSINANNGVAGLDASGKIASAQLPSYVDDVIEGANLAGLPVTGETGKIYVTLDTNKTYRWSGSAYVEISASPGSTDAVAEGSVNLYFTNARAQAAVTTISGNAGSATKLQTARNIAGVAFDGSADINIPFSGLTSKPTTLSGYGITDAASFPSQTGNAGKYLTTDGTTVSWATVSGGGSGSVTDDTSTNANYYPVFATTTSGTMTAKVSSSKLLFNPSTGTLSSTIFQSLSDMNMKTNVKNITNSIDVIDALRPVRFDWVDGSGSSYGFIAQELEMVIPELIGTHDNLKTVNYDGVIPFLVDAIKSLNARIRELESK
jgi:hypothetical protein